MTMPRQWEIEVVSQCLLGPVLGQNSAQKQTTKRRGNFHVTEGGTVQRCTRSSHSSSNRRSPRRSD